MRENDTRGAEVLDVDPEEFLEGSDRPDADFVLAGGGKHFGEVASRRISTIDFRLFLLLEK